MKICFHINDAFSVLTGEGNRIGGAEINLFLLAKEFAKSKDYRVFFIVGDFGQKPTIHNNNITIIKNPYYNTIFNRAYHKFFRKIYTLITFYKINADIYITSVASESLFMIRLASFLRNAKLIYRVAHDWDIDGTRAYNNSINGLLYRMSLPFVNEIIVQTKYQQVTLLRKMGLKSSVIKNGFPQNKKINFNDKKNSYFLWVSRAIEWKRPELFIEFAKLFPSEKFIMILTGDGLVKHKIKEKIIDIKNIEYHDYIPFDEIDVYFKNSKCFINTSTNEGFPNTFIQSWLNRVPVISLDVNPDDIIVKYNLGFYCDGNIKKAHHVIKHTSDKEYIKRGLNGYNYVVDHHNLENTINEYKCLISK